MSNVSGTIKSIQDIMRKDVGVDGDGDAQRISQLVWMFFLKIYDDREAEIELLEDHIHILFELSRTHTGQRQPLARPERPQPTPG